MPADRTHATMSAKDILAHLISFDTTSFKTNIPMAEWIAGYLADQGVKSHMLPAADGIHANLFATIGARDNAPLAGGIGLSGHMDVVPVTGQTWDGDPFTMVERDGRLYGRGTCDMKGFLACMLASVPVFQARTLKTPIHLIFSYDEEVGFTGARELVPQLGASLPKPEIIVVGEPTRMTVVDGHKGGSRIRTEITGKDAHSSRPELGVGSIFIAADLISELKRIEARMQKAHPAPRFMPPFSTITVSFIEGGIAHNIIPPHCTFYWGVRLTPGVDVHAIVAEFQDYAERALLPAMRKIHPSCAITTTIDAIFPAFAAIEGAAATSLALKFAGQNETHTAAYGTEASYFQAAGCSSVVCGPGDIAQAHQPNEFIEASELDHCMAFLHRVGDWAAA